MLILCTLLACMHKEHISNAFESHHVGCYAADSLTHYYQAFNGEIVSLLPVECENLLAILNILSLLLHFDFLKFSDLLLLLFQGLDLV